MEMESKTLYLGTTELISTIKGFFDYYERPITLDEIETIISNIILDVFSPNVTEGHLDNTLAALRSMRMSGDVVFDFVLRLYNQTLFLIHETRTSNNLDYLDKLNIDLLNAHVIKLNYDPKKKIYSTNSFY